MTTDVQASGLDPESLPETIRRAITDVYAVIDQRTEGSYRAAHDIVRFMLTSTSPVAELQLANFAQPHPFYRQALEQIDRLLLQESEAEPCADIFPTDAELEMFYRETFPYYEMQELPRVPDMPRKWQVMAQVHRGGVVGVIAYMSFLRTFGTREAALRALAVVTVARTFWGYAIKEQIS